MATEGTNEEDIFRGALQFEGRGDQEDYVKKACGEDLELRVAVQALLEQHRTGSILDTSALEALLGHETTPLTEGPGTGIGRYKLLEKIGEGGMAVVYMAEQTEPIRRRVALKIIKPGMDTRQVIARFEAERQALALMDHPCIAKVLDAGATETGRPYFVMELVQGVSITEYCDKNRLSTKDRLKLFLHVCHAVQHAHQKGIIHRDIKPSNVMVTHHDGQPIPKVIDFGIAKATNQKLTEKTVFTRYAHIVGTPAYMSPEQAELSDLDIDTRSDIYSLGVLLYELLTGATPFSEEELRKAGYLEMQRVIREQEPVKPSTKLSILGETLTDIAKQRGCTPDLLRKAIRGDLDWIVMKALEKDRTQRYETTSGFAEDIRRHLEHEPVLARGPGAAYRLGKLLRRHRSQVLAAGSLVAVAVAVAVVLSLWYQDRRQLAEVDGFRHRALLSQARGQYAQGEHQAALETIAPLLQSKHVGAEAQLLYASLLMEGRRPDEATATLRTLLTERPEIAGAAHALLARILWENQSPNAEKLKEIEEHRRQAEALLPETAEAHFLQAMTAVTIKEQLAALDKALQLDPGHFESRRLRAFTFYASRKYEKMKDDALTMIVLRPHDPLGYSLRGVAWRELNRYPEALVEYDSAIALTPVSDPQLVELYGQRCETLMRMGQYERVLADARESLKKAPTAAVLLSQVFCALTALGRYEEASALLHRIAESPEYGDADDEVRRQSMKYAFDTLAAGGQWHPPDSSPEGPAFLYMREAEETYRGLRTKARRLVTDCLTPCWSPDGTKVAFTAGLLTCSGIAVYDLKSRETNLLIVPGKEPSWSPDGRSIAFIRDAPVLRVSDLTGGRTRIVNDRYQRGLELWLMKADGSEPRRLARDADFPCWSADGRHIYYYSVYNRMSLISVEDPQAQPVLVCACNFDRPALSPQGNYLANTEGGALRIMDVATQSCAAEWASPVGPVIGCWSPDGRELSFGGGNAIRSRTGLWIYDLARKEATKVLSGKFSGASWTLDRTRLLIRLSPLFREAWVADLDPNLPTAQTLKPVQTLEEHCLDLIATCTRDLEAVPDSLVDQRTRAAAALWIGHPQAAVYLQELDLRLGQPPVRVAVGNAREALDILAQPAYRERLEPLAFVVARRTVELQADLAQELALAFERTGYHEHAAQLLRLAQADILKGSCRYNAKSDTYTVVGGGADIGGVTDQFQFAFISLDDDGAITAQIESIEDVHPWSKAGVMMRASLDAGARFAAGFVTPGHGVSCHARPVAGRNAGTDDFVATVQQKSLHAPVWIRLERQADQFSVSYSLDGATWTATAWSPQRIPMPRRVFVGIAVTSHDNMRTTEAHISHVAITGQISDSGPFVQFQDIRLQSPWAPDAAAGKDPNGT